MLNLPGGGWLELAVPVGTGRRAVAAPGERRGSLADARERAVLAAARGDWDRATRLLERAAARGGPPAATASDQAAVALAAAATGTDPLGRVTALTATDRAVRADPGDERAWYHRALVLERLQLTASATSAWRRSLDLGNGTSPRVEEARRRFHRLAAAGGPASCWRRSQRWSAWLDDPAAPERGAPIPGETQAFRLFLEDDLLPAWAEAHELREVERAETLSRTAERLAQAITARSRDPMPLEITRGAIAAGSAGARALLAYREGRLAFRHLEYEACAEELSEAVRRLAAIDNPGHLRARAYRAACLTRLGRTNQAVAAFRALRNSTYPSIRAHAAEQLGAMYSLRGAPADALPLFREAAALHAEHDEIASLAIVQGEIADSLYVLGDLEASWMTMEEALRTGARSCNAYVHGTNVWTAGDLLLRAGALEAAAAFQRESLAIERSGGDPAFIVETLRTVALNDIRLRRFDDALAGVAEARRWLGKVASPSVQEAQMGFLDWIEGTALGARDPARAVELLAQAIPRLERRGRDSERTAALLTRGRALLAIGDHEAGRADLRRAIGRHERLRDHVATLTDPAWRFADAEPAFDALTAALLADGFVAEALANSERGRTPPAAHSSTVDTALPATDAVAGTLVLDQMDDAIVAWWVVQGRLVHWTRSWSREDTRRRVVEASARLWSRDDDEPLRRLAVELLSPIRQDFTALDRVVVVPDDAFAAIPWSALPHPQGGRWLDHLVVTVAPSLSLAGRPGHPPAEPAALVVAGASLAGEPGLRLAALPGAREEGLRVAAQYPEATLLLDEQATRDAVLRRWASVEVLHFAVHAVVDEALPGAARLALAPRADGAGYLTAADIASTRFERQPLVVLSACSTRAGRLLPLAGPMDLVRAFLVAGASGVVATLRPIEDRAAVQLMAAFHREYRAHGDAPASLALAVREARDAGMGLGDWAAFQYIGADPATVASRARRSSKEVEP